MKKLRITVDGKTFDVTVEMLDAPAAAPVAAPAPVATLSPSEGSGDKARINRVRDASIRASAAALRCGWGW